MLRAGLGLAALLLVGCVEAFGLGDPELEAFGLGDPELADGDDPNLVCAGGVVADGSCFQWNPGPAAWSTAQERCVSAGGWLAKTESITALQAAESLVYVTNRAYLGASNGNDLEYEWLDGSKVLNSAWLPFNPDSVAGHCITFANYGGKSGWEDTSCADLLPFICERPL
jgi:hypothetical protein